MSSKNQSESTAAVQEEMTESSLDSVAEAETVIDSTITDEVAASNEDPVAEFSTEEQVPDAITNEAENGTEFNVTDKRRFVPESDTDSAVPEDPVSADAFEIDLDQMQLDAEAMERELEEMRVKLKESEARRDEALKTSEEYADRFRKAQLQLRAETEEVRARMQRTFDQRLELARGDVVAGLLDTLDNLQRAVGAAEVVSDQGVAFDALRDGVRATAEMFEVQLKKLGLQAVVSEGQSFNPEIHEAVELALVPKEQDGVVIAELQRGYKFGERLLRPARVKVGRAE
ncbi:MAG: nucleotide exchange factor GrpE [Blastocatellia bacterium]|nr:nucleotide exchange factor GrpE [Blastocatellia bacterium]